MIPKPKPRLQYPNNSNRPDETLSSGRRKNVDPPCEISHREDLCYFVAFHNEMDHAVAELLLKFVL